MTLTRTEALAWQRSWDQQQCAYMPDREHRFTTMLDAVSALPPAGRPPRILDLAGGTGSISLRRLRRDPNSDVTMVDLDPVLRAIAEASLPERVTVISTDLRAIDWTRSLPGDPFDAVLTATAMHWLTPERLQALYAEVHDLIAPGGILINADTMPDDGLPTLTAHLIASDNRRRDLLYATGTAYSWNRWWDLVASDPVLGPIKVQRDQLFSTHHSQEWLPDVGWHLDALRSAGFAEVGHLWRGGVDAAVVGLRG